MEIDKEDTQQQEEEEEDEKEVIISITSMDGSIEKCSLANLQIIPYFASKTSERWTEVSINKSVMFTEPFADGNSMHALICYVKSALEQPSLLLTKLPRESDLSNVIELADFFCLDLPVATNIDELVDLEISMKQIKDFKKQESKKRKDETDDDPCTIPKNVLRMARDAAAALAFTIRARKLDTTKKRIKQKLFTDVFFVVSHARAFGPRLRTHVWRSFEALAELTDKQKKQVANWTSEEALAFEFYDQSKNKDKGKDPSTKKSDNADDKSTTDLEDDPASLTATKKMKIAE